MIGLTRTWVLLVCLTAATALFAGFSGAWVVACVMVVAWLKARLILGGFLHLDAAPGWLSALMFPLAIWMLTIVALSALIVTEPF